MYEIYNSIKNKVITGKWVKSVAKGNNAAVGLTLESLLNKPIENFEWPDYKGIELKSKVSSKETNISLFVATPDSYLFEVKRLYNEYGYPSASIPEYNSFNISVYGNRKIKLGKNYFKLYVDNDQKQVILNIYDYSGKIIDNFVTWSFEMLKEKLERKLSYMIYIHAMKKWEFGDVYFKYVDINFYRLISFEKFLKSIEYGNTRVTFRIGVFKDTYRYGQLHDHGTSFNIKESELGDIFENISS